MCLAEPTRHQHLKFSLPCSADGGESSAAVLVPELGEKKKKKKPGKDVEGLFAAMDLNEGDEAASAPPTAPTLAAPAGEKIGT